MSLYDAIYRHLVFPWRRRGAGRRLLADVPRYRELLELPGKRWREIQSRQLNDLVRHAAATCPFWKKRFAESRIDPAGVRWIDDLRPLPLLEKADLRERLEEMVSEAVPPHERQPAATGGTTATPTKFYRDPSCLAVRSVWDWVFYDWMGRRPFDRWVLVWGAPQDLEGVSGLKTRLRNRLLDRLLVLPVTQLDPSFMDRFLDAMRRFRPRHLHGYSQSVWLLARRALATRREVPGLAAITVTAEPIGPEQKSLIAEAFGCPVYSMYGARECGMMAAEAPGGVGLHINPLNALVEFLGPDGLPVSPGDPGQIVVTDLLNRATPLIRYRLGDIGTPIADESPGGRGLPRMELVTAPETDFIIMPGPRYVSGAVLPCLEVRGIARLQILQEEIGRLTVCYVPTGEFGPETLRDVQREIEGLIGEGARFEFVARDSIPPAPSGKIHSVYSSIARSHLGLRPDRAPALSAAGKVRPEDDAAATGQPCQMADR